MGGQAIDGLRRGGGQADAAVLLVHRFQQQRQGGLAGDGVGSVCASAAVGASINMGVASVRIGRVSLPTEVWCRVYTAIRGTGSIRFARAAINHELHEK